MKQKLLTLFTLLVLCVTGAWAENVTVGRSVAFNNSATDFSLTNVTNTTCTKADGTGNTKNSDDTQTVYHNGSSVAMKGNLCYVNKIGGTNVNGSNFNDNLYCGFNLSIADGYELTVTNLTTKIATSANVFYNIKVIDLDNDNAILYGGEASNITVTNYNKNSYTNFDHTFTPASELVLSGNVQVRLYWNQSSTSKYICPLEIFINGSLESTVSKKSTTTAINVPGGFNTDVKTSTDAGTLTATVTPEGESALVSPAITWSSSNKDVADITSAGVVTLKTEGTTTITASYEGDETYAASSAEYSLTVTDTRTDISPILSYDNTTLILGQTTTANPTLTGNTGSGAVTYNSDNTSVATVNAETGVVTAVAAGTAHITATIAAAGDYKAGSAQATIMVATNPLGNHTLTWSIETNTSTLSSTQNSTSIFMPTSNMTGISLVGLTTSDGEKEGLSAKVEAIASYNEDKYAYVTFTVADGNIFVPTSVAAVIQAVGTDKDQNCKMVLSDATNSIESDVTVCPGTKAGTPTDVTISNDGNVKFTGTVTLKVYVYGNAATYRLGSSITISGDVIKVDQVNIAANKEWITYCSTNALDFSEDIEGLEGAYTISSHTSGATTLTATKMSGAVKAGTGLLLHAANVDAENAQVIRIPVAASGDEQSGNMLKGVIVATAIEPTDGIYTNLGLKNGSFVPYSAAGTIAANKAYLQIPTADMPTAGDAKLTIIFDDEASDETTAISGVEVKGAAGVVYNLAGQRVNNPTKGLYIINGKKVIIK